MNYRIVIPEIIVRVYGKDEPYTAEFYCKYTDIQMIRKQAFMRLDGLHNYTKWYGIEDYIDGMKVRTVSFQIFDENDTLINQGEITFDIQGSLLTKP